jgi:hypothetical protein
MVRWLRDANELLGDTASVSMSELALRHLREDTQLKSKAADQKSIIESSWSARANLLAEPVEYVLDGGLFAEQFPCQVRYVRTGDRKVTCLGDVEGFRRRYIFETAPQILEAAVFADQWDVTWAKFTEISPAQRLDAIQTAAIVADLIFHMRSKTDPGMKLEVSSNLAD